MITPSPAWFNKKLFRSFDRQLKNIQYVRIRTGKQQTTIAPRTRRRSTIAQYVYIRKRHMQRHRPQPTPIPLKTEAVPHFVTVMTTALAATLHHR